MNYLFLLQGQIQEVFWSSTPHDGPLINETCTVKANTRYFIQIEIMKTDTDLPDEFAYITLNGEYFGTCDPGGPDGKCEYESCSSLSHYDIQSENSQIRVEIQFTESVQSDATYPCYVDGNRATGVARITLTPEGNIK